MLASMSWEKTAGFPCKPAGHDADIYDFQGHDRGSGLWLAR